MKDRREYTKPTVTKVEVQPDEGVMFNCKPDMASCFKVLTFYGS